MGVNQTLAWKIMQIVKVKDPFAAAQYIPGAEGINIFLDAAKRLSAPEEVIARARAAMEGFRKLIAEHAGDRASLELMLGASANEGQSQTDLTYRKAGFQCASYTWGVQARARLMTVALHPDTDPNHVHFAKIVGYVGLRRVRPQIRWPLLHSTFGSYADGSNVPRIDPFRPIDPDGVLPTGAPLLRQFSTVPPEQIERIPLPNGEYDDCWIGDSVGDKAAISCFTGEILREPGPRYGDPDDPYEEFGSQIRTPLETFILDIFVHHELYGRLHPELSVYSELSGRKWYHTPYAQRPPQDTLSFPERVEYLGRGSSVIHTPDIPAYEDMMHFVYSRLGWDLQAADVYRAVITYPVIATAAVVRSELPRAPK